MQGSGGIAGVGILLMCMGALNASIAIFLLGDSGKKNKEKLRAFIEENGGLPEPFRNLRNAGRLAMVRGRA